MSNDEGGAEATRGVEMRSARTQRVRAHLARCQPAGNGTEPDRPGQNTAHYLTAREMPRERLEQLGSQALRDDELVALLLGSGHRGRSAGLVAADLLRQAGDLQTLFESRALLRRTSGVGPAKRSTLLAARELAVRLAQARIPERRSIDRPAAAATYLALRYSTGDQEVVGSLQLDSRHRLIRDVEHYRGTQTRAAVEPRAIIRSALDSSAAAIVLFHTHPSGDPSPSEEDLAFTRRMTRACDVMGVRLVDHLVVAGCGRWSSLGGQVSW